MQLPNGIIRLLKVATVPALIALSVLTASSPSHVFTKSDKAYYADANLINFVRPGLVLKVVSADIATDGTITAKVRITDPKGIPLDRAGITTPGPVSISCVAATIPKGQTQYTAYTTRVESSPITNVSATQAATDSGGTFAQTADGEYTYTFAKKAPSGYDRSATHTVGCQSSRNLADYDLPNNFSDSVYTFVPDGSKVSVTRDVIRTVSCNKCHDQLAFHGGSRRSVEYCVLCHTPQTTDADTGNTVDFKVMIHKIHDGKNLPSVLAGGKYQIIGFNQSVSDWSTVGFPGDVRECETCHEQTTGAAQAKAYFTPSRAACGSCHDDVDFASGKNHVDLPQVTDTQCTTCHVPQGELEFDASIKGAHTVPTKTSAAAGLVFTLVKVDDGVAGKKPTVTFTMKDYAGNPIPLASMVAFPSRVALVISGPTEPDYGYTNWGPDVITGGYVSEAPTSGGSCDATGTCTYTFNHAIPADAHGTFSIGIEGRRGVTILPGTKKEQTTEVGAINQVMHFSVDGSPITPRRQVVATSKCNQCHTFLSLHGENRNQVEMCVLCHNPSETDKPTKAQAKDPNDKTTPLQSVDFPYLIHRIHTGEKLKEQGASYTIVGFGGSHNDFTEVRFPAFSPNGQAGDRRNCSLCHVNGSEQNLPVGRLAVTNPQAPINPMGSVTTACTGCHAEAATASHALANTTTLGESCEVCHSSGAEFSVSKVHAR